MEKAASATLRLASKKYDIARITASIGIKPTTSYEKGEAISLRSKRPQQREEALWLLDSPLEQEAPLASHLDELSKIVESCQAELRSLSAEVDIELFCSFTHDGGQGGFVIQNSIMKRLSTVPIDIVVDVYSGEE